MNRIQLKASEYPINWRAADHSDVQLPGYKVVSTFHGITIGGCCMVLEGKGYLFNGILEEEQINLN